MRGIRGWRRHPQQARRLAREKALYRYSSALDRGDFGTVAAILRQAEADPVLARLILALNDAHQAEVETAHRTPQARPEFRNGRRDLAAVPARAHSATREEWTPMATVWTEKALTDWTAQSPPARRMAGASLTLAVAILAVIFFAGMLFLVGNGNNVGLGTGANGPAGLPGGDLSGAALQGTTATLVPTATLTLTPTLAATPILATVTPPVVPPAGGSVVVTATLVGGPVLVPEATPLELIPTVMPVIVTATPHPGGGGGGGMILPPGGDPGFTILGLLPSILPGRTTLPLPLGEDVAGFLYTAQRDEVLLITLTAANFTPWLHVEALDDGATGAGINTTRPPADNPALHRLHEGDRLLILVGSTNRALGGEFTLDLWAAQEVGVTPDALRLRVDSSEATMTFYVPGSGFYTLLPRVTLEDASPEARSFGRIHVTIAQGEQWLAGADFSFPTETGAEQALHPLGITPGETDVVTITVRAEAPEGATFDLRFAGAVLGDEWPGGE